MDGNKIEGKGFSVDISLTIEHYFGYVSNLPNNLHLSDLSSNTERLIFDTSEIGIETLIKFNSHEDLPSVAGTQSISRISVPDLTSYSGQMSIQRIGSNEKHVFDVTKTKSDITNG